MYLFCNDILSALPYLPKDQIDTLMKAASFVLRTIKRHCFVPGKVENWVFLMDTNNMSVLKLPYAVKQISKTFSSDSLNCMSEPKEDYWALYGLFHFHAR